MVGLPGCTRRTDGSTVNRTIAYAYTMMVRFKYMRDHSMKIESDIVGVLDPTLDKRIKLLCLSRSFFSSFFIYFNCIVNHAF